MSMEPSKIPAAHLDFFEKKIRPALIKHCYKCHSEEGDKVRGGLLLDSRAAVLQGGDSGPAVVPGKINESLLYTAITYEDDSLEMPPKYQLPETVIADFKRWIELGAPDPRKSAAKPKRSATYTNTIDVEKGREEHWAYHKPVMPSFEEESSWAKNQIDQLIESGLRKNELSPAPDASATALLRRLSFDLIGLPPSPEMIRIFSESYADDPDAAIARAASKFLDSPRFGERWGRHWLDAARYAESSGKETNATFPYAWRYRDWVIDAYNADKPFDEMITEQLAGDLLEKEKGLPPGDQTIATGFLAVGVKGLNERNRRQFRFDVADEQIDTTTRAFLAATVACSRCHDHKFDAIPMSDYYAMAGIFLSSDTFYGTTDAVQNQHQTELITLPSSYHGGGRDLSLGELIDREFQLSVIRERRDNQLEQIREARRMGNLTEANRLRGGILGLNNQLSIRRTVLGNYSENGNLIPRAMGMADRAEPFDSQILIRGEEDNPTAERVSRGFVQVIRTGDEEQISADQSGRLQLARWITSPENPLTARVYVNRVWMWLFGEGIVSSVDNFGTTGEKPSNPELLDYLAMRFIDLNWSTKDLIKEIVQSRTYRMSSDFRKDYFEKDPHNRLHWRAKKRRLDAESIRDSILAVSGQLDFNRPEGSMVSQLGTGFIGRTISEAQLNAPVNYRSVYLPIIRDLAPEALNLFDFPDPSLMAGKREVTTIPSQALYLMNSEFAQKSGTAMARYLTQDLGLRGPQLGATAYLLAFSRMPTQGETERTKAYFETFIAKAMEKGKTRPEAAQLSLTAFCQALLCSAEFRYVN